MRPYLLVYPVPELDQTSLDEIVDGGEKLLLLPLATIAGGALGILNPPEAVLPGSFLILHVPLLF